MRRNGDGQDTGAEETGRDEGGEEMGLGQEAGGRSRQHSEPTAARGPLCGGSSETSCQKREDSELDTGKEREILGKEKLQAGRTAGGGYGLNVCVPPKFIH